MQNEHNSGLASCHLANCDSSLNAFIRFDILRNIRLFCLLTFSLEIYIVLLP